MIKQNESEVGSDMLLISDYIYISFKHKSKEFENRHNPYSIRFRPTLQVYKNLVTSIMYLRQVPGLVLILTSY